MTTPVPETPPKRRRNGGLSDRAANWIIGSVSGVWVVSMSAAIVTGSTSLPDFKPPEAINGAFLLVIGLAIRAKSKDGE